MLKFKKLPKNTLPLKKYFENYKFKNATKNDFIKSMSSSCGKNVEGIILALRNENPGWGAKTIKKVLVIKKLKLMEKKQLISH